MTRYGASPAHLLAHGLAFALAAFALLQLVTMSSAMTIVVWLVAAVILHDLVLLPFYSALDRAAGRLPAGAINHVRVPAGISGLLLLVYLPGITGRGDPALERVSGRTLDGALGAWLLITAGLFAISALAYAVRRQREA